jgi:hypothetical protein
MNLEIKGDEVIMDAYNADLSQGDWMHLTVEFPTREEINKGFEEFWSKTEVKEFPKDEHGRNLRDENGDIIVIRTDKPRVRRKDLLFYRNERQKAEAKKRKEQQQNETD